MSQNKMNPSISCAKKNVTAEKITHYVLLLFYPLKDEKVLSCFPSVYQNKLQEQGIQDIVNLSKIRGKPYNDLVDQAFFSL